MPVHRTHNAHEYNSLECYVKKKGSRAISLCKLFFFCFIMFIMDQKNQKNRSPEFSDPYDLHWRSKSKMAAKIYILLNKSTFIHVVIFLIIYKWAKRMFASIFQILEKLINNLKSYMPLTKVLFSRMSILFGFFVIEGKTINFFKYIKEQKNWSVSHLLIFWISWKLNNLFRSYRSLKLKKMLCKKSDFPV